MKKDLTQGKVTGALLKFAGPMILGNLLQQCYNIADTLIVGRYLGAEALAAVGSAYTLMTFLTSILIGLCMGSGAVFSVYYGKKEALQMKKSMLVSFLMIAAVAVVLNLAVFARIHGILHILRVPREVYGLMYEYVWVIFFGIFFVFLYNYFAFLLRSLGNSLVPLIFLGAAAALNIGLDIYFVVYLHLGAAGAAGATVIAQAVSGLGIALYTWAKEPGLRPEKGEFSIDKKTVAEVARNSTAACVQQSVMNFGILMIQGLVNSFGPVVMAAFAAAVKIDSFAYMPAQEFGNAFSLFISQNHGAGKRERVRQGTIRAAAVSATFCAGISLLIFLAAPWLMQIFVDSSEQAIIATGAGYLRVEGAFYCGIGVLFLLYGFYRGVEKPEMSLVLTVISLGTRVLLAYVLSPFPQIGVWGIWWAIPIGWFLADLAGIACMRRIGGYGIITGTGAKQG
ncbi:multidrug export protein MepA [Lachnospiraceae bacterium]|nr:multidrug export protein MepA [Lachnospiraceae bacterium]